MFLLRGYFPLQTASVHGFRNELFLSQPSPNVEGSYAGPYQVRFGSKADISACPCDVRFTPESGHRNRPVISFYAIAPAAWRCSPRSLAPWPDVHAGRGLY